MNENGEFGGSGEKKTGEEMASRGKCRWGERGGIGM